MSSISVRPAWQMHDDRIERDAIALWQRLGQIPQEERAEDRAKQLITAAYSDQRLVGVTTASIRFHPPVRAKLAFFRILVDPDFRGQDISPMLIQEAFRIVELWSKDNPAESVAGLASVLQSAHLMETFKSPYGRSLGAPMVDISPKGNRISVSWFSHYRA